ncbi:phosphatidylserine/phosphatidylglycerophosphate/cardiolipin synthase family protein [Streptomyces sp. NPDC048172]|uniref:phospholipase D-like domain-containing protein n=1 Tax=Streptomyces sp. NPDC048172 TaxID=3365505 RepID=UPI00371F5B54
MSSRTRRTLGKRQGRAVVAAVALGVTAPLLASTPAAADPPGDPLKPVVFNDPRYPEARDDVQDHLIGLIRGARPGSTIRLSTFLFRDRTVAKELAEAADEGVTVKVLADSGTLRKAPEIFVGLRDKLTAEGRGSWAKLCEKGCLGSKGSPALHSKFALFSNTFDETDVSFVTTSNLTTKKTGGVGGTKGWNSGYTAVGNKGLHKRLKGYFDVLKKDKPIDDYYNKNRPRTTGNVKTYFHPRNDGNDTIANILKGVTCRKDGRRTKVRVSNWWVAREKAAWQLRALALNGCSVDVVANQVSSQACRLLTLPVPFKKDVRLQGFSRGARETGNHQKHIMIDGTYLGKKQKVTVTGSENFTPSSLEENDELLARVGGSKVHDAFVGNFKKVKKDADVKYDASDLCKKLKPVK